MCLPNGYSRIALTIMPQIACGNLNDTRTGVGSMESIGYRSSSDGARMNN